MAVVPKLFNLSLGLSFILAQPGILRNKALVTQARKEVRDKSATLWQEPGITIQKAAGEGKN